RGRVGVSIELDDAETSLHLPVDDAHDVRVGNAVIASDDDRNRAGGGNLRHEGADVLVGLFRVPDDDFTVAVVGHLQVLEGVNPRVQMGPAVGRRPQVVAAPYGLWTEVRACSRCIRPVPGDTTDRDIDLTRAKIFSRQAERQLHERLYAGIG